MATMTAKHAPSTPKNTTDKRTARLTQARLDAIDRLEKIGKFAAELRDQGTSRPAFPHGGPNTAPGGKVRRQQRQFDGACRGIESLKKKADTFCTTIRGYLKELCKTTVASFDEAAEDKHTLQAFELRRQCGLIEDQLFGLQRTRSELKSSLGV